LQSPGTRLQPGPDRRFPRLTADRLRMAARCWADERWLGSRVLVGPVFRSAVGLGVRLKACSA